ncbi:MAG TPA: PaaI family thioesterase [Cellvibrio sp.]|nr:PaaI family thioesterase [Cellvibrio sp.]
MNQMLRFLEMAVDQTCNSMAPPFTQWLNGTIRKISQEKAEVEYVVRKEMTNMAGLLHGGVQCGMMDDAMGMLANALGRDYFMASVNLSVDYLEQVKEGQRVITIAEVVRNGRNILNMNCTLQTLEGRKISKAHSNLTNTTTKNPMSSDNKGQMTK